MGDRAEAAARLGVPHCAQCGKLSGAEAKIVGHPEAGADVIERPACSARCAVTYLDTMHSGTAKFANSKRTGVIATKQKGKQIGIWPKGRKRIGIENRRAARDAKS